MRALRKAATAARAGSTLRRYTPISAADAAVDEAVMGTWAAAAGVTVNRDLVELRTVADGAFAGRGLFTKRDTGPGDIFAVVPERATMRPGDLFKAQGVYFGLVDPSAADAGSRMLPEYETGALAAAFARAFHAICKGGDAASWPDELPLGALLDPTKIDELRGDRKEHPLPALDDEVRRWWELALVIAFEDRLGQASVFHDYIRYALPATPIDITAAMVRQLPLLSKPPPPPLGAHQREQLPPEQRLPVIQPLTPAGFTECRQRALLDFARRDEMARRIANVVNANLALAAGRKRTVVPLRPERLRWAFDVVSSRANNFSFKSTPQPRPYGLTPDAIPGAEATLCPMFDLMNHAPATNVLVADCLTQQSAAETGPAIIIGSIVPMPQGTELCYMYNAPCVPGADGAPVVDVAGCLIRWGFVPPPPQ